MELVRLTVVSDGADGRSVVEQTDVVRAKGMGILWEARMPLAYGEMGEVPRGEISPVPPEGVVRVVQLVLRPRRESDAPEKLAIPMHRTDTLDLIQVESGSVELVVESGSLRLDPGDRVVIQGDMHGWRNVGEREANLFGVTIGAAPQRL